MKARVERKRDRDAEGKQDHSNPIDSPVREESHLNEQEQEGNIRGYYRERERERESGWKLSLGGGKDDG